MGRIIDISSKLDVSKPILRIGDKDYEVNDSLEVMLKFEEVLDSAVSLSVIEDTLSVALGKKAVKEINISQYSYKNVRVFMAGILAAIQGDEDVDVILSRFQDKEKI